MFQELDFIERKNGHLDLDDYLYEKYGTVNIKSISKTKEILEDEKFYWITINENKYMFKPCTLEEGIKEILASEMLEYVGYEHAEYDLASINGSFGVITRNLKKENCKYILGDDIILEYDSKYGKRLNGEYVVEYDKYNNLSDVWNILEIRYKDHPNKANIVKNIMYKLTEKFMFDILINQWDGASYNWMIEEADTYVTLFPIHDNQKMLDAFNNNKNIKVEEFNAERTNYNNIDELKKFLSYSSEYFRDEFKRLIDTLYPENVKRMFVDIENKLNYKINSMIKDSVIARYKYNYNKLLEALDEELTSKR